MNYDYKIEIRGTSGRIRGEQAPEIPPPESTMGLLHSCKAGHINSPQVFRSVPNHLERPPGKGFSDIREKKTGMVREIPLNPELTQIMTSIYVKMGSPDLENRVVSLTTRGVNKQLKIYAAKAGIRGKRISTHTFRKTFGREVWKRNNYSKASLIKLSQLFKHSSTSITRIYLSITKEEVDDLYNLQDLFVY